MNCRLLMWVLRTGSARQCAVGSSAAADRQWWAAAGSGQGGAAWWEVQGGQMQSVAGPGAWLGRTASCSSYKWHQVVKQGQQMPPRTATLC